MMNCPNCDYELSGLTVCPNCGIDPILFIKTGNISNRLYNRGLQEIKNGDLYGAQDSLQKSLEFNKNNYVARNLLGLVYHETGRIGDALRHWIISASIMKANNPAREYINDLQKNARTLERYADAVNMYNQALEYVSMKSDDMAIIQLKKAIEFSPKFVDAMNLLAFCYLIQKDKDKALVMIERVLAIDLNNPVALNYYNEIFPSKNRMDSAARMKKAAARVDQPNQDPYAHLNPKDKKSFGNMFPLGEVIGFIIGGLCVAAVMFVLVMPARVESLQRNLDTAVTERNTLEQEMQAELDRKDETIAMQETEIARLTGENTSMSEQVSVQNRIQNLNSADEMRTTDPEAAADIIYAMDPSGLPGDARQLYEDLESDVYPRAAQRLYDNGVRQYNNANYDDARNTLEKCLLFADSGANYLGTVYYYLGRIAEDYTGDISRATEYYTKVVEDYPNSGQLSNARTRLNNL